MVGGEIGSHSGEWGSRALRVDAAPGVAGAGVFAEAVPFAEAVGGLTCAMSDVEV